jgi:tetratricopeptide (TPR) repeat protein
MTDSNKWQQIGDDFVANGHFKKAIDAFQQDLNYDPYSLSSGIKIGLLLYKIGRDKQGAQYLAQYQIAGLGQRLLELAQTKVIEWLGLSDFTGKIPDKKTANIFFLSAILDYQVDSDWEWDHTKEFAETTITDPKDLWRWITHHSFKDWKGKKKTYGLHRFPYAHERVWTIGKKIVGEYDGDVRNIWLNQPPDVVKKRISSLVGGIAIPRMILGALRDTEQISSCKLDVKPDVHVCTMLYRLLYGAEKVVVDANVVNEVIDIARQMNPENPWDLDDPLFHIGRTICKAKSPNCPYCRLMDVCAYHLGVQLKKESINSK